MSISEWFNKNKVLIIGLLSAIILPIYDLVTKGETSTKVIVMAASVALTGYLARNLRGQWQTIAGIIGTVLATYLAQSEAGQTVSWIQLLLQGLALFLTASSSPAKSIGYEKQPVIVAAKIEGEKIAPPPVSLVQK